MQWKCRGEKKHGDREGERWREKRKEKVEVGDVKENTNKKKNRWYRNGRNVRQGIDSDRQQEREDQVKRNCQWPVKLARQKHG